MPRAIKAPCPQRKLEDEELGDRHADLDALDRQIEPVVMESEISGLPDLHAFMKYENYVTGFSFPYLDMVANEIAFQPRDLPDDKLKFEAKTLEPNDKDSKATTASAIDLEAKPNGETKADQPEIENERLGERTLDFFPE